MSELQIIGAPPIARQYKIPLRLVEPFDQATIERYVLAAESYRRCVRERPKENRCRIALIVGARIFSVPIAQLQAKRRDRLTSIRQQLMAFSRVVSLGDDKPNSWMGIARCFNRRHQTVMHAALLYGELIEEIIRP
jgi:chromosomal replication initiation ATPase DnaA